MPEIYLKRLFSAIARRSERSFRDNRQTSVSRTTHAPCGFESMVATMPFSVAHFKLRSLALRPRLWHHKGHGAHAGLDVGRGDRRFDVLSRAALTVWSLFLLPGRATMTARMRLRHL